MLGPVAHFTIDALLISMVLCGIKRNTGLTFSLSRIHNRDLRHIIVGYLEAGEWVRWLLTAC